MPQPVSELHLPHLDTMGLERQEAMDAVVAARSAHWLARTDLGYAVTRLQDVDRHPARPALPLGAVDDRAVPRARGHALPRRAAHRVHPHHGGRGPRPPAPPGRARLHAGLGQPAPAHHAEGGRRAGRPDRRPGRVRAGGRCLRSLPHPHHLRAPRRAARGLEALLRLGHRHLPHLQQQPRRGHAPHRAGERGAQRLRERDDRGAAGRST